jgi:Glycosyl transferase family group 2
MRVLLLIFFFVPLIETLMLVAGEWWFHTVAKVTPGKYERLIIQITTTGREQDRVNEIIGDLRSLGLSMPYRVWVVNEPGQGDSYPRADRVITVPADFEVRPRYKGRALEYSRRVRRDEELDGAQLKILFLDDDTMPTREYVEAAFASDYDVCQGVTAPRVQYGSSPFGHFVISHMDDMRFLNCLIYCSFFQGLISRPLFVHGEGLCITGSAEQAVTWDYPLIASEDLVFGQNAVDKGLSWGFFHEYVEITSPWTWPAFIRQRRRWFWGNVHAIFHREVMSLRAAVLVGSRYVFGAIVLVASVSAAAGVIAGAISLPPLYVALFWASFACWTGAFALAGWINSRHAVGRQDEARKTLGHRVAQTAAAIALCPLSSIGAVMVAAVALAMGDPKRFDVIPKTRVTAHLVEPETEWVGQG